MVTAANKGIGHDVALALGGAGARVVAAARRPETSEGVLGTNHDALDVTEQERDELMAVSVRGPFFACQSAARHMIPQGYGRIVNMASPAGLVGIPGTPRIPPQKRPSPG